MDIAQSFSLQEITEPPSERAASVLLPVEVVNLLTQVRRSIGDVGELAGSVHREGQLSPGIAVALTRKQAREYVKELNAIRGSKHTLKELNATEIDGTKYYIVLIAGHRRYTAVKKLVEDEVSLTKAFGGQYRATLHFGMSIGKALALQFQENRHTQVPPDEEAAAAWYLYRYKRRTNPKLSLRQFGKEIGRSESWVANMVRFCSLPPSLQDLAALEKNAVPYGILVEAARLASGLAKLGKTIDDNELTKLVVDAVADRTTVTKFRKLVSSRLQHARDGQGALFELEAQEPIPIRQVVAPHQIQALYGGIQYLLQLQTLFEQGLLGKESPLEPETDPVKAKSYSPGSPIRLSAAFIEQFEKLLPELERLAKREGGRRREALEQGQQIIQAAKGHLETLEEAEHAA